MPDPIKGAPLKLGGVERMLIVTHRSQRIVQQRLKRPMSEVVPLEKVQPGQPFDLGMDVVCEVVAAALDHDKSARFDAETIEHLLESEPGSYMRAQVAVIKAWAESASREMAGYQIESLVRRHLPGEQAPPPSVPSSNGGSGSAAGPTGADSSSPADASASIPK